MSIFSQVPLPKNQKSVFDLSYDNAFTAKFGSIIPCYFEDVIPSDHFRISAAPFVRMNPLSAPIMGRMNVSVHYFFVPYRIIWDEWEKFITGGANGTSTPVMPYISGSTIGDTYFPLMDTLGLARTTVDSSGAKSMVMPSKVSALGWRAYWKIINDYFRDENLTPDLFDKEQTNYLSIGSGDVTKLPGWSPVFDDTYLFSHYQRAWRKDLFTSALPFAQRGAPVDIPILPEADVLFQDSSSPSNPYATRTAISAENILQTKLESGTGAGLTGKLVAKNSAGSFNINDLREASAIQRFLERNAIGGARYKEQILSHFGVEVPDYRLARPEFLGGCKTPIMTSQVLQTSQTNTDSVLGTQGGHGISAGSMVPFDYYAKEHGCIIGVASITPDAYYSQGINRAFTKFDKLDYFYPYFENLGEQAITNKELYISGNDSFDNKEFGYAPRYYEYKHRVSEVHGDFRNSLAYWIPQRIFSALPALNPDFVKIDPSKEESLNNIFAVTDPDVDPFYCVVSNAVKAVRPISKFSKFKLV